MIYKNIISFTILYFTDVFKRHFENIFLPHEKGNREYFAKQNDIFPRKCLFLYKKKKKCGIPDTTESYSFQSVSTTFCTEINH